MHLVTTVTLLCVALAARADGSAVQSPAIDASDSLCRSLDTACANLWISIQCKVTKSCVPRWELTDSSAVGNDTELCALCKKMVKQARHQLLTNETQSEIRQVVDGSCDIFLPVTPLNTLCKKLMNLFVDELNDVLVSRMNPTQVCSICGLCWASTKKAGLFDRVSYVTLSKEHEEAKCNACKNTIRRAVSFAELIPQDKVVDGFMKICEVESGNRKQQCEQFAQIYVDKLFEAVKKDTPERSCQALEQCPGDMLPTSNFVNLRPYGDVQCEFCEAMLHQLIVQFNNTTTKLQVKAVLEGICRDTGSLAKECLDQVTKNFDVAYDGLLNFLNSPVVCRLLGLCSASAKFEVTATTDSLPMARLTSAISRQNNNRKPIKISLNDVVSRDQDPSLNSVCTTCELVVSWVATMLNATTTENDIIALINEVCDSSWFPDNQRNECRNMVAAYGSLIMHLLVNAMDPHKVCTEIKFCAELTQNRVMRTAEKPAEIGHEICEMCQLVARYLVRALNNNKTEQAILAAMKNVCSSFSTDSAGQCRYFISTYGDQLLKHIGQDLDLQEAHKTITPRLTSSLMGRPLDNSQKCSMCQIMVNIIEFGLRNNNSRHEIEIFLNKVCSALSTDEQATCRTMIDVYTSYIIQMIENLISSKEICQALTFCPRQAINIKCEICIFILNLVEDQLGNNQTESEILEVLDKSCDLLSPQNVSECRFIVKQFVDMTITLLVQNAPPRKICEEVRQCPKALQPVKNIASISAAPLQRPDEKCSLCKWLITWVDDKLKENHTEAIIKEELDKACDLLNDSTECKEMANSYVDMIVKMLVQYVDPEQICETLGKCPKKAVLSSRVEPPCQLCKYYVHELRDRLNSSNAEAEIKSGLDQICAALSVDGKECTDLVDRYTHLLIRVILENTDLEVVCRTLKVCPTKITIRPTATNCDYCQKIVNFISMEVKNEDNDEKIIEVIEKVCDYVPIQYQEDCHRMVEIDGMVIFRMIAESVDPDIICAAIKLCSTNGPDLVCTLCEYSLHYIQEKLYDNATQAEIRSELDKMCAKLKNPGMASDCKEFIDVYGSALEVIIAQKLDPSIICPTIHACPSSRGIRTGRRPSTARCHDCMSLTNANPLGYQSICVDMKSLSLHKCENAAMAGEIGGSNLTICKLIKACYAEQADKGSFTCTSRGCKYTA
ncbi:uncharacterized protein LOC111266096 isoform X4 [Varroa jacobsoni]|uniref:uncharacterized protein LOC111266096 isoform X4 n=1 Tax=Varroa jacobsoni TaxID=62625 RepID=UPI000BF5032F|nr:uncharacterized protein LOC111266096 isoform X4 [Varroa jacobsoni]